MISPKFILSLPTTFFYLEKLLLAIVFGIDKNPLNDAPLRPYPFISLMIADKNEKFVPPPLPDCERRDISLSANKGEKWIRKDFSSRIIREIFPSILVGLMVSSHRD